MYFVVERDGRAGVTVAPAMPKLEGLSLDFHTLEASFVVRGIYNCNRRMIRTVFFSFPLIHIFVVSVLFFFLSGCSSPKRETHT